MLLDAGTLTPGTYDIAISDFEYQSFAENLGSGTLADGFTGLGSLQPGEDLHFAFDVVITPAVATPEPALAPAITAAGVLLCFPNRRRKPKIQNLHD